MFDLGRFVGRCNHFIFGAPLKCTSIPLTHTPSKKAQRSPAAPVKFSPARKTRRKHAEGLPFSFFWIKAPEPSWLPCVEKMILFSGLTHLHGKPTKKPERVPLKNCSCGSHHSFPWDDQSKPCRVPPCTITEVQSGECIFASKQASWA